MCTCDRAGLVALMALVSCAAPGRARDAAATRGQAARARPPESKRDGPTKARDGEPQSMVVPAGLREKTGAVEPSGIAWSQALGRYLIVSDDTGRKRDGTRHAPWLFAMDPSGKLDAEPVPVLGMDRLNDPEAITAGPEETFFITTSHSPDKKGRTRPERRILLHAGLAGKVLRVLGRVDLTEARDTDGRGLLGLAGLDESGRLDIEALAYREKALYIGLKSPLTAGGGAVILRLADPAAALHAGRISPGALTRFAEVSLRVESPAGPVPQGLADLLFLSDGSLVLLGNSPKGLVPDGGGALWWLRHPGPGTHTPTLLHRYSGLKPEGVSLAADGRSLIIVFDLVDQKRDPPRWSRWPLPR